MTTEAPSPLQHDTIFKKLGGWTALTRAVDLFYKKLLTDDKLKDYFAGVPMQRLHDKQVRFMAFAFGGANAFFGRDIAHAHRDMILRKGLNLSHFDAVAGHFVATLTELGVAPEVIQEAAGVVLTTRSIFDPETYKKKEGEPSAEERNVKLLDELMELQAKREAQKAAERAAGGEVNGTGPPAAAPQQHSMDAEAKTDTERLQAARDVAAAAAAKVAAGEAPSDKQVLSGSAERRVVKKTKVKMSVLARALAPTLASVKEEAAHTAEHQVTGADGSGGADSEAARAGAGRTSKLSRDVKLALLAELGILPAAAVAKAKAGSTSSISLAASSNDTPSKPGSSAADASEGPVAQAGQGLANERGSDQGEGSDSDVSSSSSGEYLEDSDEEDGAGVFGLNATSVRTQAKHKRRHGSRAARHPVNSTALSTVTEVSETDLAITQRLQTVIAANRSNTSVTGEFNLSGHSLAAVAFGGSGSNSSSVSGLGQMQAGVVRGGSYTRGSMERTSGAASAALQALTSAAAAAAAAAARTHAAPSGTASAAAVGTGASPAITPQSKVLGAGPQPTILVAAASDRGSLPDYTGLLGVSGSGMPVDSAPSSSLLGPNTGPNTGGDVGPGVLGEPAPVIFLPSHGTNGEDAHGRANSPLQQAAGSVPVGAPGCPFSAITNELLAGGKSGVGSSSTRRSQPSVRWSLPQSSADPLGTDGSTLQLMAGLNMPTNTARASNEPPGGLSFAFGERSSGPQLVSGAHEMTAGELLAAFESVEGARELHSGGQVLRTVSTGLEKAGREQPMGGKLIREGSHEGVDEEGKMDRRPTSNFDDSQSAHSGVSSSLGIGMRTLYEKLGSMSAIQACVALFYKKILADPLIAHFFADADMEALAMKQAVFMAFAFGGAPEYPGRSLATAHAHLVRGKGLNLTHFDRVAHHFVESLTELGVETSTIDDATMVLLGVRPMFDPERILELEAQDEADRALHPSISHASTGLSSGQSPVPLSVELSRQASGPVGACPFSSPSPSSKPQTLQATQAARRESEPPAPRISSGAAAQAAQARQQLSSQLPEPFVAFPKLESVVAAPVNVKVDSSNGGYAAVAAAVAAAASRMVGSLDGAVVDHPSTGTLPGVGTGLHSMEESMYNVTLTNNVQLVSSAHSQGTMTRTHGDMSGDMTSATKALATFGDLQLSAKPVPPAATQPMPNSQGTGSTSVASVAATKTATPAPDAPSQGAPTDPAPSSFSTNPLYAGGVEAGARGGPTGPVNVQAVGVASQPQAVQGGKKGFAALLCCGAPQ